MSDRMSRRDVVISGTPRVDGQRARSGRTVRRRHGGRQHGGHGRAGRARPGVAHPRGGRLAARPLRGGDRLSGHSAAVTALLASASLDRTARLWLPAGARLHCVRVVHAHSRYLTCVALAHDMRYMVTGSNDRSLRMWSLGSLTLDDQLDIPCEALSHFGLGDLKGIGPLDDEVIDEDGIATQTAVAGRAESSDHSCLQRLWSSATHAGAINDIATHGDLVATASSDGTARVFRWSEERGELEALHELASHEYPVLAVDFAAAGAVLLTAGLDGRACLWDVETGVQLRSLCVPAGDDSGAGGEAGGGGVRAARASPTRAALILLGTDDGLTPLWSLDDDNPQPLHVYSAHSAAVTCCGWSCDARLCATGSAAGELRLYAPPPHARLLHCEAQAHDLGTLRMLTRVRMRQHTAVYGWHTAAFSHDHFSFKREMDRNTEERAVILACILQKNAIIKCAEERPRASLYDRVRQRSSAVKGYVSLDFAPSPSSLELGERQHVLATAGGDSLIKLWLASQLEDGVAVRAALELHGGGGGGVRWAGALLAVVSVGSAGGVLAVGLLGAAPLLLAGSLSGSLAVWQLPAELPDERDDEEGTAPCFWTQEGVRRWLRDCVSRVPGSELRRNQETFLTQRCQQMEVTGSMLLSTPIDSLLETFGFGTNKMNPENTNKSEEGSEDVEMVSMRMREELQWLQAPPPSYQQHASKHASKHAACKQANKHAACKQATCKHAACSMQASMQTTKQAACKQASKQHASKQHVSKHAASKQTSMQQANSMQASMVSVTAPALRGSGGPTRANRRRRLSLATATSACWPASPASLSCGGSLIAACSSARGPPRPSAPTRF
ncbi:hypothetical protein SFRURICE_012931 [Spodoptera frugiperda]|nr:hypothetical protein SFRURICE_012931 [Spodoptera frugiperda]